MRQYLFNVMIGEPLIFLKGVLVFLIGPINIALAYLLLAVLIDVIFGVQLAVRKNRFKIKMLFNKVYRKLFVYALWISMFNAFDMVAGLPNTGRWAVIVMLLGMELLSSAKNTAKLGHGRLSDALEHIYTGLIKTNPPMNKPEIDINEYIKMNSSGQEGEKSDEDRKENEPK